MLATKNRVAIPSLSLDPGMVKHTARELAAKHLVRIEENPRTGAEKYRHRFCNTTYSNYQFEPDQFALVCLLLLRGAQMPGELKARCGRLHVFADNSDVVTAAAGLIERDGDPLLVKLPRTPGRKDGEFMHLFCGPIDIEAHIATAQTGRTSGTERINLAGLVERVSVLETEMAALKDLLKKNDL